VSSLDWLFSLALTASSIFITTTDKMTEPNPISEGIVQELLTTVKGFHAGQDG